jgi:hypothetical protein
MTEIKPALTKEEWASLALPASGVTPYQNETKGEQLVRWAVNETYDVDRHGLAALCLHNQPYGFTWEDVEMIQSDIANAEAAAKGIEKLEGLSDVAKYHIREQARIGIDCHKNLVARLSALLPPRE